MSDHLPFEIQVEVLKRLPVKSLIQFRSVSKPWKSVIDSPGFIAGYTLNNRIQPPHLLIGYVTLASDKKYTSIVDDSSFPQNKVSATVPPSVSLLSDSYVVGSSHGMLCLFGYFGMLPRTPMAVLWNPSIRKSVTIAVPDVFSYIGETVFGFGVCPATNDPKIVKIHSAFGKHEWVDVYSLSSGVWRSSFGNLSNSVLFSRRCYEADVVSVTTDEFIYWFGDEYGTDNTAQIMIISFDLSSEEFGEVYLPAELAFSDLEGLFLCKRSVSPAILKEITMNMACEVWIMENGVSKSFIKLFTIIVPVELIDIAILSLEVRSNGDLLMIAISVETDNDSEEPEAYELSMVAISRETKHIYDLGIKRRRGSSFLVSSYTESLFLIDQ